MFELNHIVGNNSLIYIVTMVLAMGLRHGFDLDHLAAIDAITRATSYNISISSSAGLLFSLGHGTIVTIISIIIGSGLVQFQPSHAIDLFGKLISIIFLLTFGLINIYNLFSLKISVKKAKITNFIFECLIKNNYQAASIFAIGALFAISFDTFSQIMLLILSASSKTGWVFSFLIGVLFMLGMIVADGLNGLLVAKAILCSHKISIIISRLIGFSIAAFSLTIGVFEVIELI